MPCFSNTYNTLVENILNSRFSAVVFLSDEYADFFYLGHTSFEHSAHLREKIPTPFFAKSVFVI